MERLFGSVITSVEKWGYVLVQIIQCQNLKITSCNSRYNEGNELFGSKKNVKNT
jgi:hypothetical protein